MVTTIAQHERKIEKSIKWIESAVTAMNHLKIEHECKCDNSDHKIFMTDAKFDCEMAIKILREQ